MNIRLVQFNLGPGNRAAAESVADKVVPLIRAQPGCESCEFFVDNGEGDYGLVVRWESQQAADEAASVVSPVMMPALAAAHAQASIRLFDVYEPK